MKSILLFAVILTFTFSCGKGSETKKLDSYLHSFGFELKDYKVICFVPVDGCEKCFEPSLEYFKKTNKNCLLVLSSTYRKSINYVIESKKLENLKIVSDSQNLAASLGLVQIISPCFYFLKNGRVVKIIDLSNTYDKTSVLKEIDQFMLSQ